MDKIKELTDQELIEKHIEELLPSLIEKLYTFGDKKVRLNPLTGYRQAFKNYETITSLIDPEAKIMKIFKKLCEEKCVDEPYPIPKDYVKYEAGYEVLTLPVDFKLYKGFHWFFPPEADKNYKGSSYFADVYAATYYCLVMKGGLNVYKTKKELKLLVLDNKSNVQKIIKTFIDPFLNGKKTNNLAFYKFMKWLIGFKYNVHNTALDKRIEDVTTKLKKDLLSLSFMDDKKGNLTQPFLYCNASGDTIDSMLLFREDDIPIATFISYIINLLGYDGTYTRQQRNPFIAAGVQHLEININNCAEVLERLTKDPYDWINWGIDSSYLLPYSEFSLSRDMWGINNYHKGYLFYKKMLLPSVKSSPTYDYGVLKTNNFIAINEYFNKTECMKQAVALVDKFKLKFICLNGIESDTLDEFLKIVKEEKLHTSITDFETNDTCIKTYNVVVSSKPLDILGKEVLPEPRISRSRYYVHFKHPDTKNTYIATELAMFGSVGGTHFFCDKNREVRIRQLIAIKAKNPDVILGTMHISLHSIPDYKALSGMMYALNNGEIDYTNLNGSQTEYIMTKLPMILSNCDAINYKYSNCRVVLGKL